MVRLWQAAELTAAKYGAKFPWESYASALEPDVKGNEKP
jgi:hypothetical protein